MKEIRYQLDSVKRVERMDDLKRIVRVSVNNGVILTLKQAEEAWEEYNDAVCAGWMGLPKSDEDLWDILAGNTEDGEDQD